jgi:hypothetical protein
LIVTAAIAQLLTNGLSEIVALCNRAVDAAAKVAASPDTS